MRRENRKQGKVNSNKTVFITGGILLLTIATFIITFIVYSNKLDNDLYSFDSEYLAQYTNTTSSDSNLNNDKETTSASSSIGKTVEESKKETNNNTTKENETKESNATKTTSQKSTNKTTSSNKNKVEKDPTFVKPIEGEILKEYAKDSLIYSETLKEWTRY